MTPHQDQSRNQLTSIIRKYRKLIKNASQVEKELKDDLEFLIPQGLTDAKKSKKSVEIQESDPNVKRFQSIIQLISSMSPLLSDLESFQLNINHEKNYSEKQSKEMEQKLLAMNVKNEDLNSKLNELREKHRDVEATLQSKEKIIARLQDDMEKRQELETSLKKEIEVLKQFKIKLEKSKDQAKLANENEGLTIENKSLKGAVEQRDLELKRINESFSNQKTLYEIKIRNLEQERKTNIETIQKLEATIESQNNSMDGLRKELQACSNQFKMETNKSTKEARTLSNRIKTLESHLEKEKEFIATLKEKNSILESKNSDLTNKLKVLQQNHNIELKALNKELESIRQNAKKEHRELQHQLQQLQETNIGIEKQIDVYKEMLDSINTQEFKYINSGDEKFDNSEVNDRISRIVNIYHTIEIFDIAKPDSLDLRIKFISDQLANQQVARTSGDRDSIITLKDFEAFDYFSRIVKGDFASQSRANGCSIAVDYFVKLLNESEEEMYERVSFKTLYKQIHELSTSTVSMTRSTLFPFPEYFEAPTNKDIQMSARKGISETEKLNDALYRVEEKTAIADIDDIVEIAPLEPPIITSKQHQKQNISKNTSKSTHQKQFKTDSSQQNKSHEPQNTTPSDHAEKHKKKESNLHTDSNNLANKSPNKGEDVKRKRPKKKKSASLPSQNKNETEIHK